MTSLKPWITKNYVIFNFWHWDGIIQKQKRSNNISEKQAFYLQHNRLCFLLFRNVLSKLMSGPYITLIVLFPTFMAPITLCGTQKPVKKFILWFLLKFHFINCIVRIKCLFSRQVESRTVTLFISHFRYFSWNYLIEGELNRLPRLCKYYEHKI